MSDDQRKAPLSPQMERSASGTSFYDRLGGRPTIDHVHKVFYDKLYSHSWIGKFFAGISRELIEAQQSDFMGQMFGGPRIYGGRMPAEAHVHMYITDELFDLRHEMLRQSLTEAGVGPAVATEWLSMDKAFRRAVVKKSITDCQKRFTTDEVLNFPKPENEAVAGSFVPPLKRAS